jgi:hypothetical protein
MKEIKVRVHSGWTSYTYLKWNREKFCSCFKRGGEER